MISISRLREMAEESLKKSVKLIRIIGNDDFPITVLADKKASRHFNKNYYFTCSQCKNASWYDETYCNNQDLIGICENGKREKMYCSRYELRDIEDITE